MHHDAIASVDSTSMARRRWTRVRDFAVQVVVVTGAALLYFGVRGITEGSEDLAIENAETLLRLEERFGFAFESSAQALILEWHAVVTFVNWVYIWGHWPVIIGALLWLYVRHRHHYRILVRSMLISGAIGLVIFALYPVSPPRLLPEAAYVDTVTELSRSYRVLQPPALVNKFAALPSLHVGWNLLVGIVVFRATRQVWLKVLAVMSPMLMMASVVLTGNHYVIDGLLGSLVALVGLAGAAWLTRRGPFSSPAIHELDVVDDHSRRTPAHGAFEVLAAFDTPDEQDARAT